MNTTYHPTHRTHAVHAVLYLPPRVLSVHVSARQVHVRLLLLLYGVRVFTGQDEGVKADGTLGAARVYLLDTVLQLATTLEM